MTSTSTRSPPRRRVGGSGGSYGHDGESGQAVAWRRADVADLTNPTTPDLPMYLDHRVYQGSSGRVYPMPSVEGIARQASRGAGTRCSSRTSTSGSSCCQSSGASDLLWLRQDHRLHPFYRNRAADARLVGPRTGRGSAVASSSTGRNTYRPGTYFPDVRRGSGRRRERDRVVRRPRSLRPHRARTGYGCTRPLGGGDRREAAQQDEHGPDLPLVGQRGRAGARPVPVVLPTGRRLRRRPRAPRHLGLPWRTVPTTGGLPRPRSSRPGADRIDYYRNIPAPTSYMVVDTDESFFGGYDHAAGAGVVHWADRRIAPGKKQWTWGNSPGHACRTGT